MASGGGETGYWPGFVDALSNMVMTLIIIIVLLNVALVFFFFKATKSANRTAQAAVETAQKANAEEIEALQEENVRLNEELKKALEKIEAAKPEKKPAASTKQANVGGGAEQKKAEQEAKDTAKALAEKEALDKAQEEKEMAAKAAADKIASEQLAAAKPAEQSKSRSAAEREVADTPIEAKEGQAGIAQQNRSGQQGQTSSDGLTDTQNSESDKKGVVSKQDLQNNYSNKRAVNPETNKNIVANQNSDLLIITYEDDNVEFSPATLLALNNNLGALISKNKNIKIDITVEIMGTKGYSYSRRVAYYRASSIRNFVLAKGLDPSRVVTKLVDASEGVQFPRAMIRMTP